MANVSPNASSTVPAPQPVTQTVTIPELVTIPEPVTFSQPVEIPAEPVYTQTYEEPTYIQTYKELTFTIPETTSYQYQTTAPNVKIYKRGSGITLNEQQSIISCASNNYQNKITPLSNKTAQAVKIL